MAHNRGKGSEGDSPAEAAIPTEIEIKRSIHDKLGVLQDNIMRAISEDERLALVIELRALQGVAETKSNIYKCLQSIVHEIGGTIDFNPHEIRALSILQSRNPGTYIKKQHFSFVETDADGEGEGLNIVFDLEIRFNLETNRLDLVVIPTSDEVVAETVPVTGGMRN